MVHPRPLSERMEGKYVVRDGGCWEWIAGKGGVHGGVYGVIWSGPGGRQIYAHRAMYELHVGPIPDGLTIDHLCCNYACVNPDHLRPATQKENILRGNSLSARRARQTHCVHGHEFTPENTILRSRPQGGRLCRTCNRERKGRSAA